jgi:hypothetical protein
MQINYQLPQTVIQLSVVENILRYEEKLDHKRHLLNNNHAVYNYEL